MSMNKIYLDLCSKLVKAPVIGNTKELNNYKFVLKDIHQSIITIRGISKKYLLAELLWYINERNDKEFIGQFASLWNNISDDGITNNSAYGYILGKKYGFNQIEQIIELLKKDPNSRRAVLNISDPAINRITTKDMQCTVCLQFLLRDNKLNCTGYMRSNDVWFGLPYDVVYFTFLQKYIAYRLGVGCGSYTHFVGSIHMYLRDEVNIKDMIKNVPEHSFDIDYWKLLKNKDIIDIVNKDNILDVCREKGILINEK